MEKIKKSICFDKIACWDIIEYDTNYVNLHICYVFKGIPKEREPLLGMCRPPNVTWGLWFLVGGNGSSKAYASTSRIGLFYYCESISLNTPRTRSHIMLSLLISHWASLLPRKPALTIRRNFFMEQPPFWRSARYSIVNEQKIKKKIAPKGASLFCNQRPRIAPSTNTNWISILHQPKKEPRTTFVVSCFFFILCR